MAAKKLVHRFDNATKSFSATPKTDEKDRIDIEVGDSKDTSEFFPQVKIMRWDNEVNASFRLKEIDYSQGQVQTEEEKIKWINGKKEVHFYDKPELSEDGGYEFEVILKEKPASNKLEFTIETKGLDFYYQPPLTQQEIDEGAERPENVVGSYAVYHKTKGGLNDSAGMEYKVGKAFHIYRPHVVDSLGNETWADLNINEQSGILTITIDQTWLDNAVYPVVVDPTFGYTSVGGSSNSSITNRYRGVPGTPAEAGDVTKITVYVTSDTSGTHKSALYVGSDLSLVSPQSAEIDPTTSAWNDYSVSNAAVTAQEYYVTTWSAGGGLAYDISGSENLNTSLTYGAWPDPAGSSLSTRKISCYATYTATPTGIASLRQLIGHGQGTR